MIEEQVGNIQKHTDDANIIKDSVSLVEETTPIDEQKQKIDLAKTSVETEKLTGGKKADKPSVRIKVFLICMRCTVIQTKRTTILVFNLFHLHIFLKYELIFTYHNISNMTNNRFCLNTFILQFVYIMFENSFYISLCSQKVHNNIFVFPTTRKTSVNSEIFLQTLFDFSLFSQKRQRLDINKQLLRRYVVKSTIHFCFITFALKKTLANLLF